MKRIYFLVLFFISTAYLFPQTEENRLIKTDTIIRVDTVIVIKVDTVVVAKPINEHEEKIDDCRKIGIISVKAGSLIFINAGSVTWDVPITCKTTIAAKGFYGGGGFENGKIFSGFGLGIGFVSGHGDIITKFNIYPSLGFIHTYKKEKPRFGLNVSGDIILWKVFSIGLDSFALMNGFIPLPTIGLNIVY